MKAQVLAVPALLAASAYAECAADNCLRALRATQTPGRLETARAFCATFTVSAVAQTAIPTFALNGCKDNQNALMSARISSACSCIATTTTSVTSAPPTGQPTGACASVSSSWAAQVAANPSATPTVAASLANDCLKSVPLGKQAAIELVEAMEPYLEWQSDAAYKAAPPSDYFYPAYDLFKALADVKAKLEGDKYDSEYAFQADLYATVFGPGHDGHYVFYPDLLTKVFDFNRQRSLVSVSEDGTSLPVIKIYEDVLSSPSTASAVTKINGIDAAKYVEDVIFTASFNQDADAAYNTMFFEKAFPPAGAGKGYFSGGGRIRFIYQGANTTFTFANGTEATFENYARVKTSLAGITDGASMYQKFCSPSASATVAGRIGAPVGAAAAADVVGYPPAVISTEDGIVSGYYLEGDGLDDVAVVALLAFENDSPVEFQSVLQKFFAQAVKDGKKKLVIDFSANGGGYILQGYDFFRQLFPDVVQDGYSRWKENDGFMTISRVVSDAVASINPNTSSDSQLINDYLSWFNWRYDLDINDQPFTSFEDKFDPHVFKNTPYTDLMRWNLWDPLTTKNATFGIGIDITGYRSLANATAPFAPENIVMLLDGFCASTCTLAAEMLRLQGGVPSIAMGGRPKAGGIQGVGGIKGSQVLQWADIKRYVDDAHKRATTDAQRAALSRYSDLPVNRSTAAAVNVRDQILRGNVQDGLPAQYVYEEADCRLYWTEAMVGDVREVWKAAANAAFKGAKCAHGGIKRDAKRSEQRAAEVARRFVPVPVREVKREDKSTLLRKREVTVEEAQNFLARHEQVAIP
ncbi:uncharacterized protein E0L32_001588 [Thyridium curvatum]|nr:uncharacterized protein E0L32_001588 [Thyridium curvatum]TPX09128.1 hypothetical protein E0L32_001588 [Thyridium curvatum]